MGAQKAIKNPCLTGFIFTQSYDTFIELGRRLLILWLARAQAPSGSIHCLQSCETGQDPAREGMESPLEFVENKTKTEDRFCFSNDLGIILSRDGQNF